MSTTFNPTIHSSSSGPGSTATKERNAKLQRDAKNDPNAKSFLRDIIRRDIKEYHQQRADTQDRARNAANRLLKLDTHNETVREVAYSCARIERLLEQLQTETKVEEVAEVQEAIQTQRDEAKEEADEIQALRVFASDDTTLETSSVADYAADPPGAPLFSDSCIEECVNGVKESSVKAANSSEMLTKLITENAQWWNSAIVIRRLKTHAIRANYHMRKVKKWGDQCRSHVFVSSSVLNKMAQESTKELRDMKQQMDVIAERKKLCEDQKTDIETTSVRLQDEVAKLVAENEALDRAMREQVKKDHGMDVADSQVCEAILLLSRVAPAAEVRLPAERMQTFLAQSGMALPPPRAEGKHF